MIDKIASMSHYFSSTRTVSSGFALLLMLGSSGCSTQAWFEGMRTRAANECAQLPGSAYEDCMRRIPTHSYEDYERQRTGR